MNNNPFDFPKKYQDNPELFMLETEWRELKSRTLHSQQRLVSLKDLNDLQFKEVVVEDILAVTMYELQTGHQLSFDMGDLYRYLTRTDFHVACEAFRAVKDEYVDVEDRKPRIKKHKLEDAMKFTGVFYTLEKSHG